ncbi:Ankyrin repeat domain-containing protein 44 [Trapelia coarctata]|nr:Ankyrin repeat domain-containing protein 44 [Trapelia coarctata]
MSSNVPTSCWTAPPLLEWNWIMEWIEMRADQVIYRFRWVVCQLDSFCDLFDDDSRRRALTSLPPNLGESYERILERLESKAPQIREMAKKVLRWLVCIKHPISLAALAEAVTIKDGDSTLQRSKILTPRILLRLCSSLVRTSADYTLIELAHFSVREFLVDLAEPCTSSKFSAYGVQPETGALEIGKTLLTYLCMDDFADDTPESMEAHSEREQQYSLRRFASYHWDDYAHGHYDDPLLISLAKKFFQPSKSCQFLSWTHDMLLQNDGNVKSDEESILYEKVLSRGADTSTLHWACQLAIPAVCQWLVESGCDVNKTSICFGTPLHCLIIGHMIQCMNAEELIEHRDYSWRAESRNEGLKILLKAKADPNFAVSLPCMDDHSISPVFAALRMGAINCARTLLGNGAVLCTNSVHFINRRTAVVQGKPSLTPDAQPPVSEFLFEEPASSETRTDFEALFSVIALENIRDEDVAWFVDMAAGWKSSQAAELHKNSSQNLDIPHMQARLRKAASNGLGDLVEKILDTLNDGIDEPDEFGNTALHLAAGSGFPDIVRLLIKKGANIQVSNEGGATPLHRAIRSEHLPTVAILLEAGSDVMAPDNFGNTAAHCAARLSSTRIFKSLHSFIQSAQSGFSARDMDGATTLLLASMFGSMEVVEYILEVHQEADPRDTDSWGENCLHSAVVRGSEDLVKLFLDLDLDPDTPGEDGSTSFHIAAAEDECSEHIMDLLLNCPGKKPFATRDDGGNCIHLVCWHRGKSQLHKLNRFLECDRDDSSIINAQWEGGMKYTPLHCLVNRTEISLSTVSMIETLCNCSDIDMNVRNTLGHIPLVDLVRRLSTEELDAVGSTETLFRAVKILLDKTTGLDVQDLESLLEYTCTIRSSNVGFWSQELLEHLLTWKADLCTVNQSGKSGYALILQQLYEAINAADKDFPGWWKTRQQHTPSILMPVEAYSGMLCTALDYVGDTVVLSTRHLGYQVLGMAIATTNEDLIQKVLRRPVDVDQPDENVEGRRSLATALQLACVRRCSRSIAKELVERSCKLSDHSLLGNTPIHLACFNGSKHMVAELLAHGIDPNQTSTDGNNALVFAAQGGFPEIVDMLINSNVNINNKNHNGLMVLHVAAEFGQDRVIERLLTENVDWTANMCRPAGDFRGSGVGIKDLTALHLAAESDSVATINLLVGSGHFPNVNTFTTDPQYTPLHLAVMKSYVPAVKTLLDCGASPSLPGGPMERTPLHLAAVLGFAHISHLLLKAGSDCQKMDNDGATPELLALAGGHTYVAQILREHVAKQRESILATPGGHVINRTSLLSEGLAAAIKRKDVPGCEKLIEYGADPRARIPQCKCTPLILALESNRQETLTPESYQIARLLVENGAPLDASACEEMGFPMYTPIHYAALFGSSELLELLLRKGSRKLAAFPLTPLHLAAAARHTECMTVLLDHELHTTVHENPSTNVPGTGSPIDLNLAAVSGSHASPDLPGLAGAMHLSESESESETSRSESMIHTRVPKDIAMVCSILDEGIPRSMKNLPFGAPLHMATLYGRETAVDLLIDRGADVELTTLGNVSTPLHIACGNRGSKVDNSPIPIIRRLLEAGANVNCCDAFGRTPFLTAASAGLEDVLKELQSHGADVKSSDREGMTAMHHAIEDRQIKVIPFLLSSGLDLSAVDRWGYNALHEAIVFGDEATITSILNQAGSVGDRNKDGANVLNLLCEREDCKTSMAEKLIAKIKNEEKSAMLNNRSEIYDAPLYEAAARGNLALTRLLLEHGAILDMVGGPLGTALMAACAMGRLDVVKFFVGRGAETEYVEDGKPISAYEAAAHHKKVQEWLLSNQGREGT